VAPVQQPVPGWPVQAAAAATSSSHRTTASSIAAAAEAGRVPAPTTGSGGPPPPLQRAPLSRTARSGRSVSSARMQEMAAALFLRVSPLAALGDKCVGRRGGGVMPQQQCQPHASPCCRSITSEPSWLLSTTPLLPTQPLSRPSPTPAHTLQNPLVWFTGASLAASALGSSAVLDPRSPAALPALRWAEATLAWFAGVTAPVTLFTTGVWMAAHPAHGGHWRKEVRQRGVGWGGGVPAASCCQEAWCGHHS
jgi:hypothetical protein